MSNPLLVLWQQIFGGDDEPGRLRRRMIIESQAHSSAPIFLILRRMRIPLITLIVIFTISVLGLAVIPGVTPDGTAARMGLFDAFYFMSYTATTIGFGELPYPFTSAQRMWVTFAIYLTVIGWAYAIGSLLTLLQDRSFRQALALQRFTRKVSRLREPFLLMAGYGRAGELLGASFDALGQRFVVVDRSVERIDGLELASLHSDVPGLADDASDPNILAVAGLNHSSCAGVLALTDHDETNLAVTMAAALLRPELPVIARTVSRAIGDRMRVFGTPTVVNPFDRFGDHLRLALRAPASYQLMTWLEGGPGAQIPGRGRPPVDGRWVMCGYGRFGRELTADLRSEGLDVTVIEPTADRSGDDASIVVGDGSDPAVMQRAMVRDAVGFVAGTDNDTTNLSLIAAARRLNPELFVAARQNKPSSAPLFRRMRLDALLVPTEVVAHEVYAQLSTPLLWRFIQDMPAKGDAWAAEVIRRLAADCGPQLPALWRITLNADQAPALVPWLGTEEMRLGPLLRSPEGRERRLHAVPLLLQRGSEAILTPDDDTVLRRDDQILFAGPAPDRRELETTLVVDSAREYVFFDRSIPEGWVWRRLTGKTPSVPR